GVNSFTQTGLARLNSDGTFDFAFRPAPSGVSVLEIQRDGSIIKSYARTFSRYFSDGTLDEQFTTHDPNVGEVQLAIDQNDRVYYNSSTSVFQISGRNRI